MYKKSLINIFNESIISEKIIYENKKENNIRKKVISDFVDFCCKKLNIKNIPKIVLVNKKHVDMSSGCYIPNKNKIKVLYGNRAALDVCRSIAHELVHRMQDENDSLKDIPEQGDRRPNDKSDIGVWFEDEANAKAGALVKQFSRSYNYVNNNKLYEI